MDDIDIAGHDRRLKEHHERLCRTAATSVAFYVTCNIRKCRRDRGCTGPMVESDRQASKVAAQRFMGLSGSAAAHLPLCVALVQESIYHDRFLTRREAILQALASDRSLHLPRFDRRMNGRPWTEE
ncbi:MAG TPA: hypothetical protein DIC56_21875 [Rhizobium sp.]|nr:hypothetical protein [Rhizobium sp.]